MNLNAKLLGLGLALFTLAPAAAAQAPKGSWGISVGKRAHGSQVSIHAGKRGLAVDLTLGRRNTYAPRTHAPQLPRPAHIHNATCRRAGGHYETRSQQVWVPGRSERVWTPAQVEVSYDAHGRRIEHLIAPGHWNTVQHPGRYESRTSQVWVPGAYLCASGGITPYPHRRPRH
jgi:hypothetical protein